jgi:tetratricopeptide (TPR) repeat protein
MTSSTTAAVPGRVRRFLETLRRRPGRALLGAATLALFATAVILFWPHGRAFYHAHAAQRAAERWDFDEARSHLAVCLRTWPDSPAMHFQAARVARRAGQLQEAQEHLSRTQALEGPSLRTEREWALLRVERGEVSAVEDYLKSTVGPEDPDAPLVLEALARGYLMNDRLTDVLEATGRWLEIRPGNTHALFWRGLAWDRLGNGTEALAAYREAVEADSNNDEARLHLAEMLLTQTRNPEEALGHFEQVRGRRPADVNAAFGVARCQVVLGHNEAAKTQLDALLADHPHFGRASAERGRLALDSGDAEGAEKWLRRAFVLTPDDRAALYNLIRALRELNKTDEANQFEPQLKQLDADLRRLREIITAVTKDPRDLALRTEAAKICLRHGRKDEGRRWLATVLRIDPSYAPALDLVERTGSAAPARPAAGERP